MVEYSKRFAEERCETVGFKQLWTRFTDGFLQNRLSYAKLTGDNTESYGSPKDTVIFVSL